MKLAAGNEHAKNSRVVLVTPEMLGLGGVGAVRMQNYLRTGWNHRSSRERKRFTSLLRTF